MFLLERHFCTCTSDLMEATPKQRIYKNGQRSILCQSWPLCFLYEMLGPSSMLEKWRKTVRKNEQNNTGSFSVAYMRLGFNTVPIKYKDRIEALFILLQGTGLTRIPLQEPFSSHCIASVTSTWSNFRQELLHKKKTLHLSEGDSLEISLCRCHKDLPILLVTIRFSSVATNWKCIKAAFLHYSMGCKKWTTESEEGTHERLPNASWGDGSILFGLEIIYWPWKIFTS